MIVLQLTIQISLLHSVQSVILIARSVLITHNMPAQSVQLHQRYSSLVHALTLVLQAMWLMPLTFVRYQHVQRDI
jgi:hypothetical protein